MVCAYFAVKLLLPGHMGVFVAVLSGLAAGVAIGAITEYFTSDTYKPTQRLAASSETGSATVIISGLSLGMLSTVAPVVIVGVSVLISYFCAGGTESFSMGLYGVGVSAVGMLSTLGITLATDAYGPIADNAGGIAEMTHMPAEVRQRTDALDSLGNTTAATGKGFAIGSAALTALALIVSYIDKVQTLDPDFALNLSITNPTTLIGLFIGGMLPFLFAALTMDAVGKAAQSIVVEVRRQFREITGLLEGKAEPDYAKCVDMCTRSAQKLMLAPALIAVIVPIVVGLILGVNGVAGLLAGTTITGFVLAVMMSNAGGAWDNAKKYIESGAHGGKGLGRAQGGRGGRHCGRPLQGYLRPRHQYPHQAYEHGVHCIRRADCGRSPAVNAISAAPYGAAHGHQPSLRKRQPLRACWRKKHWFWAGNFWRLAHSKAGNPSGLPAFYTAVQAKIAWPSFCTYEAETGAA